MKLLSSAYEDKGIIPVEYANLGVEGGQNISIPYQWEGVPEGTKSLVLAMIDITANQWTHWFAVDIPPTVNTIPEGASNHDMPSGSREMYNSFGSIGYGGPQPPIGSGDHAYVATLYALDTATVSISEKPTYGEFLKAIDGKIIDKVSYTGLFGR
ncbi:MAG TPA: YbhB/YbcL family Raf kinase inhibitor-like protein [Candidatus Aquicultor sp.]